MYTDGFIYGGGLILYIWIVFVLASYAEMPLKRSSG